MKSIMRSAILLTVLLALTVGTAGGPFGEQYKVLGKVSNGYFGWAVANAGDQDGDGIDDVLAGVYGAGQARVISGVDGSEIYLLKGNGGDDFGTSVAAIPDFDGDGLPEFIVGSPSGDYVKVFSSSGGKEVHHIKGMNGGENFGRSVAGIDDLDGDGLGDFAVGANYGYDSSWNQTGYVMVFSGSSGKNLYTVYGSNSYEEFGTSVAGGADVDGDGYGDFAVGAPYGYDPNVGSYPGYVMIFSGQGGKPIAPFFGDSDYSYYGQSVALAGDVNADGSPDLVVGAPYEVAPSGYYGLVRVISGADGSTIHTMYAGETGATEYYLGWSVCALGDFNEDGYDDFAAGGEYLVSPEGVWSGGVRAWSGADGKELFSEYGDGEYVQFGLAICALSDTSTGLHYGLIVGAPSDSEGGSYVGAVHLFKELEIMGSVSINGGAPYATSPDVTLDLTWSSPGGKVQEVRVRNVEEDWGDWVGVEEQISWTLSAEDGTKQVEVEFRDDTGETATFLSKTVLLDTVAPSGTLTLANGAAWTNQISVDVAVAFTDGGSGVLEARMRNQGQAFGSWFNPASPPKWTLTAGEGMKTVQVECRDRAGNLSSLASDTVGLDQTAPNGNVSIEAGATYSLTRSVNLNLSGSDSGGSGLLNMRFKALGTAIWGAWIPFATTSAFTLPDGDGVRGVDAQFADGAGNISGFYSDTIILDLTPPILDSFSVSTGLPYVLPGQDFHVQISAHDGTGSGVEAFCVTYDGGQSFTDWLTYSVNPVPVSHPGLDGEQPVQVVVRDLAGNTSALSAASPVFFVGEDCYRLLPKGSYTGSMSTADALTPVAVDLVKGDILTMKVKATPANKGASFPLVYDVWLEDGTQLATGIPALFGWPSSVTGRVYMIARLVGPNPGFGTYTLGISVKQNKAAGQVKATVNTGEAEFEASDGSTLKASLKGDGLDPASVEVIGPDGKVMATASGKPGSAKLTCVLDQGTGTYRIRFTAAGPVKVSLGTKLPKGTSFVEP